MPASRAKLIDLGSRAAVLRSMNDEAPVGRTPPYLRVALGIAGTSILLVVFGLPFFDHVFRAYKTEIAVEKVAAARSCRSHRPRRTVLFNRPRERSGETDVQMTFCGVILTDGGIYLLPDSADVITTLADQRREDIYDSLSSGCRYLVRIRGGGPRVTAGDKPIVPPRQTISRVVADLGCG